MQTDMSRKGSVESFDTNWRERREAKYNHWIKGRPQNQIQLAFRNHWKLFSELMAGKNYKTSLEVGAGRGSLSSYFADNGFECTLLDTSPAILETAKDIFTANGHQAHFIVGNALAMDYPDNSFDVVSSIGLWEHFEDIRTPILEQIRVLKPGGRFFGYIVPERQDNVQRHYRWINKILKATAILSSRKTTQKSEIFRSDFGSERYLPVLEGQPVENIMITGMYPLPMISHSPEFPFSLLPKPFEIALTRFFEIILLIRKKLYKRNPWMCDERTGQAFLLTFTKKL